MNAINRQRGMSALGIFFVLLVISFLVTCTVKLFPHYMDSWTLASAVERSIENNEYKNMSVGEIRSKLGKYIDVNRIEAITARDVKITRKKGLVHIDATYEVRVEFIYNMDVVMKFDKLIYEFPVKS